jgi:hypothetical protein
MIHMNNVELHNVEELPVIEGRPGRLLQRIPNRVLHALREPAQAIYRRAAGCEIRFVSDLEPVGVQLASYNGDSIATVYIGDYFVSQHVITQQAVTLHLELPSPYFLGMEAGQKLQYAFSPKVWRIMLQGGEVHLLDVQGASLRPPAPKELPARRYLAYGTSITQGVSATSAELTYVSQAAWCLKADAINLGVAGNAYCEPAIADYIADRNDWDFASLCISVNMLNQGVSVEEFEGRAEAMVRRIAAGQPNKPLLCIGLIPLFMDQGFRWPDKDPVSTPGAYREALQTIVRRLQSEHVHYVDGRELFGYGFYGMSHDLLHPGNNGMIEMGRNLARYFEQCGMVDGTASSLKGGMPQEGIRSQADGMIK